MKKFKKLVASLLAVLMVLSLAPVTALADGIDLHPIHATQQPAEEPAMEPAEQPAEEALPEEKFAEAAEPAAVSSSEFYRIVHLDCGRKYFSKDWIVALMYEAKAAGYNQVQLAFGNKGLRFLLDDMSVTVDDKTYGGTEVAQAIQVGNKAYYDAGERNELTQSEMDDIFRVANEIGIEIVPLFNTPFHMEAVITAMDKLDISNVSYSNKAACLNLSNTTATAFVKALMQKYVDYFSGKGCKYFNFGADEYEGGWNSTFYNYANGIVGMISGAGMTARIFNDSFRSTGMTNYVENAQVCYWSSNAGYASTSVVNKYAKEIINTNQDFYYVVNRDTQQSTWSPNSYYAFSGSYDETKWVDYAKGFSNTEYKNFAGYNNGAESVTPVGSMFCIWCDNPSHKDETQIAKETRMIMRVIGARMQDSNDYSGTDVIVEGGFNKDGTINVSTPAKPIIKDDSGREGIFEILIDAILRIFLPEGTTAEWYVSDGADVVELIADDAAAVNSLATNSLTGNAVQVRALKAGTATITATLDDGTAVTATVTVKDNTKETITVTVGGTKEVLIEGNYAGTYATANPETATVTAEYESVAGGTVRKLGNLIELESSSNGKYTGVLKTSKGDNFIHIGENGAISNVIDVNEATIFEVTKISNSYTIKVKDKNLYLDRNNSSLTMSSSVTSWSVGSGHDFYYNNRYIYLNNTSWTLQSNVSDWGNCAHLYNVTEETTQAKDQTKLTFTGHKVGTTTVIIAGVEYTINVVAEDLSDVSLPINLWITNTGVVPTGWSDGTPAEFTYTDKDGNRRSIYTLKADYAGVYSENGIELSSILPVTSGMAKSWDSNTYDVVYWKSAYHVAKNRQSTDGWTNSSHLGVQFTYIRYWDGSWAYSVDGSTWVNIENVGAGAADTAKNQVNLWYRQKTEITTEVETQIVDWGPVSYSANQCLLDFAVKYESGEQVPNSFPVTGKTMGFDCPTNQPVPLGNGYAVKDTDGTYYRTVYGIAGVETADYEVYMITLTPSSDTHSDYITKETKPTSYPYNGTEKIAWAKTEEDANSSVLAKISTVKYGGEPFLESVKIYQYQGLLVTYYIRAKETADSLKVHYINRSNNNEEFYNYSIAVKQNTVFNEGFAQKTENSTELVNNTVENKKGEIQTVLADLKTMPQIAAQYRYSNYTCVEVNRSDDGKEVFLYYTFNSTQTFVVDFGLPLVIKPTDMNSNLGGTGVTIEKVEIAKISTYADITVDENKNIVYKLNQMISGHDNFGAKYTGNLITAEGKQNSTVEYSVTIIPASTVYYEDSFVDFYDAGSDTKKTSFSQTSTADEMGVWYVQGDETTEEQALEVLGKKTNVYGYDSAYNNSTMLSMGSAKKVTVKTNGQYAQAKFTFKGTGFDVISLTDSNSGAITVEVFKDGVTAKTKDGKDAFYLVNNYYGYKYENGQWVVTPENDNALYQIPVMKVNNLDYGTYTVVITADYATFFDKTGDSQYSFWLDAIRVYDPMGEANETYKQDEEGYPQYIKLRNELVENFASVNANLLFIDGAKNANVATYANFGPNNEVYLANGQAISFKLNVGTAKIASIQIGAKAPSGTAVMVVNGDAGKTIGTATEMYYEISKDANSIIITNTGDGILSLTNLKITYSEEGSVSLEAMNEAEQTNAVMMVRALFAPPAPVVFEPETFTVKLSNSRDVYVRENVKVTVTTSDDVDYITVGDKKITRYTEERTWGGFRKGLVKTGKRIWSYYVNFTTAGEQVISVVAYDENGLASEAVENTVNVKPRSAWRGKTSEWHI